MENNRFRAPAMRTLAVLGFLAIIIIGIFGSIFVARAIPGALSNLASALVSLTSVFVPADEEILISVPSLTVTEGETFEISWEHSKKSVDGSYTFRYDCADGVSFTSPAPNGSQATVFCNTPFNFLNSENSISLTPISTKNRFIDVTLHIDFTPNGAAKSTVTGSSLVTIANEDVDGSPSTTTPETPDTTGTPTTPRTPGSETSGTFPLGNGGTTVSNPTGFVDLTARIIEVGLVNKNTGEFTASSTPTRSSEIERVAVRFAVENIGTRTSDQWTFNAVLPTYPSHIFSSPTQQALGPGDRIEFTIAFDKFVDADEGLLTINIDPTLRINESNKSNNILQYTVKTVKTN